MGFLPWKNRVAFPGESQRRQSRATQPTGGGDVAPLVEHRTVTPLTQVRFLGSARGFLPESTFSADSLTCVRTPSCAITCIYMCAHVKDPVVHVRVRWIMKTLKHLARTVGWVARLCHTWLSSRKATRISHGKNLIETMQL